MQKATTSGEETLEELKNLRLPQFTGLGGLMLFVIVSAGIGASTFAFLELLPAIITTAAVGLILGVAAWFLLKSLAKKRTLRTGTILGQQLAEAEAACHRLHLFAAREYEEEHERITEKHARKRRETELY